jgi:hypothetical protein
MKNISVSVLLSVSTLFLEVTLIECNLDIFLVLALGISINLRKGLFPESHPAVFLLVALIPGRYARDFYLTWGPWVATLYLLSCPVQVRMQLLKDRPHKNCSYSVTEMDA